MCSMFWYIFSHIFFSLSSPTDRHDGYVDSKAYQSRAKDKEIRYTGYRGYVDLDLHRRGWLSWINIFYHYITSNVWNLNVNIEQTTNNNKPHPSGNATYKIDINYFYLKQFLKIKFVPRLISDSGGRKKERTDDYRDSLT